MTSTLMVPESSDAGQATSKRVRWARLGHGPFDALRLTLRHYYWFGADRSHVGDDLVTPESWDALRTKTSGVFSIPSTRADFVRVAEERHDIEKRARAIDAWLEDRAVRTVGSYGVGGASLEWWLHRLRPERRLIVTDYGKATVDRLAELFPEADVRYHDLRRDPPLPAELHLFHRIDTEFTNREWRELVRRFSDVPVLVVVADLLDLRGVVLELRRRAFRRQPGATRAGFIRTRAALEALWHETHTAQPLLMNDLYAWALTPRRSDETASLLRTHMTAP
jgi:hypothetical protein